MFGVWRFDEIWEAEKYVKIAELYLEDDDPVAADTFCSRAAMVMHEAHGKCVEPKGGNGEVSRFFNFDQVWEEHSTGFSFFVTFCDAEGIIWMRCLCLNTSFAQTQSFWHLIKQHVSCVSIPFSMTPKFPSQLSSAAVLQVNDTPLLLRYRVCHVRTLNRAVSWAG